MDIKGLIFTLWVPFMMFYIIKIVIEYIQKQSIEEAENNSKIGIQIIWFISGIIIAIVAVVLLGDSNYEILSRYGELNVLLIFILSILSVFSGIGIWKKKKWGLAINMFIIPIFATILLLIFGFDALEIFIILGVLSIASVLIIDLLYLWKHWEKKEV